MEARPSSTRAWSTQRMARRRTMRLGRSGRGGVSWKAPMGLVRRRTSRKRGSIDICGSYLAALVLRFVAEASQQLVEVVAQAGNSCRIFILEAVGELAGSSAGGRCVGRIHDLMQSALDGWLIGLFDLVQDVPDLVRPAALNRDAVEDAW